MGTTRESKVAKPPSKKKTTKTTATKAAAKTAKPASKTVAKKTKTAAASKPAALKAATRPAAKTSPPAKAATSSAAKAATSSVAKAATSSAAKAAAATTAKAPAKKPAAPRKRALAEAPEAESPRPAAPAPVAAPPARDPREERRARLEEKLAQRSAALREMQQQRAAQAPEPRSFERPHPRPAMQAAPAPTAPREPSAPVPFVPRGPRPALSPPDYRPDLPFNPQAFRPGTSSAATQPSSGAPALEPADGEAGRRRRRRRRRRRGDLAEGASAPPQGMPAPSPRPPGPPQGPPAAAQQSQLHSIAPPQEREQQGFEEGEGGRRRRRRRRRRRGDGFEAQVPQQVAPQQRPAPPPRQREASAWSMDDEGGGRRGRRRRRRQREFDGPLPWDPDREAPAVNILPERDPFSELVSIDPDERIDLETDPDEMSMRVVDLVTPFGKGQRALIVAPPKTGKTTLLMQLARAITLNHPEMELIVMLIDERPEEVTAFRRAGYGEVVASSNDEPNHRHLKLTQHVLDVAKRRVVEGKDVCILLDSITRMARAHNVASSGHKTLSGGLDSRALEKPKRFFGAARKIADGGSLTILATALIDTGSRGDEVIFQEFKGTGNSELQLDRRLAERRIWPAIDIQKSGTRKEEKLFERDEFEGVVALRRALSGKPPAEAMQMLLARLAQYRTNREFLLDVARKAATAL